MQSRKVLNYTLLRLLGKGGMAEVWYAENQIEKPAAVKILNEDLSHNAQIVERFRNEAKITVKLNHPNIRQVYEYDEIDGRPCMVMEYLEGDDLSSRMKHGERFTEEQLEKWWNQLASALNYTHAQGVVHRDLKPSNIFITTDGNVKLLDFGIAKVRDSITSTATGAMMGTLMYMSPEQVRDSKHIDHKTDLYSLAVTFVHLLTGQTPYDRDTTDDFEIRNNIVNIPLDMTGVPAEWQNFLRPYLAKNPANRPALTEFGVEASPVDFVLPVTPPITSSSPVSEETFLGDATVAAPSATDEGTVAETPSAQPQTQPRKRRVWPWILVACAVAAAVVVIVIKILFINHFSVKDERITPVHDSIVALEEEMVDTNIMYDYDSNKYKTVKIGEQVWMAENLRTTHYSDGTPIPHGTKRSCTTAYWYYPNNDSSNKVTYGLLYNWKAVMRNSSSSNLNPSGVQGVCPNGWHVPSSKEWDQLSDYVRSENQYVCGENENNIAKALASTEGWLPSTDSCSVGNNPDKNNSTGFSAFPAGYYYGECRGFGEHASFSCSTQDNGYGHYIGINSREIHSHKANLIKMYNGNVKPEYLSVRCVKD